MPIDMDIPLLITGAAGFMGRNLAATLKAEGYTNLLLYDLASAPGSLEEYAAKACFVFHLAGVNRPSENEEYYTGNSGLTQQLLAALKNAGNKAPVLLSSTAQAGNGTDYAKSKEEAETAVFSHGKENGSPVFVYRLAGVFGKWSRPDYNTVVATFCHNIARGLPIVVRDPGFTLPLCYIDDVVSAFMKNMTGYAADPENFGPGKPDEFLGIEPTYEITLGWLAGTIRSFAKTRESFGLPEVGNPLTAKLWATYQSFVPPGNHAYPLKMHVDEQGSFTEFVRTHNYGQVSVNVAKPGITKGNHWHNTKNEKFLVVSGKALIRIRSIDSDVITEYPVSGDTLEVVDIPPGATHNIENVGDTDLVTIMWASEPFDPECPDTYFEKV